MTSELETVQSSGNAYLFCATSGNFVAEGAPGFSTEIAAPSLGRYWRTLKHLRTSQIYYLLRNRIFDKNDLSRWHEAKVSILRWDGLPQIREWQPQLARRIIEAGHIQFLKVPPAYQESASWADQEILRRQIYHANYCDFLNVDLSSARDANLLHGANQIALDWCDQNPSGQEMGWHPFFVSLRVVNWLKYLVRNAASAEDSGQAEDIQRILQSVRIQVLSLEHRLEKELLANHLLKNAKALVFAGILLDAPESRRWRDLGQRLLLDQIAQQTLHDGGHIERSPMYHAWVLDHLLDIQNLFASCPPDVPGCAEQVANSIEQMAAYLSQVVHPDG